MGNGVLKAKVFNQQVARWRRATPLLFINEGDIILHWNIIDGNALHIF